MDDDSCGIPVWDGGYRERCGREMAGGGCPRHGRKGTGFARGLAEDYFRRIGQPCDGSLDAFHRYEMTLTREWLGRLEAVLDDEGVPRETAYRVVRCMLYGSPTQTAAEVRSWQESARMELLKNRPGGPGGCRREPHADAGPMTVRIVIDPNVRVRGNKTYAGFEDVLTRTRMTTADRPVQPGDKVLAVEPESSIVTDATVVDVDYERKIIYLAVDWQGWRDDDRSATS